MKIVGTHEKQMNNCHITIPIHGVDYFEDYERIPILKPVNDKDIVAKSKCTFSPDCKTLLYFCIIFLSLILLAFFIVFIFSLNTYY